MMDGPVIVTGAAGFLGIHIVDAYLTRYRTRDCYLIVRSQPGESAQDRVLKSATKYNIDIGDWPAERVHYLDIDLTDYEKLSAFSCLNAVVIHCAAQDDFTKKASDLWRNNVLATELIARWSMLNKAYLLHVSSCAASLFDPSFSDPYSFRNRGGRGLYWGYGETKRVAEEKLILLSNQGLMCTVIRLGYLYTEEIVESVDVFENLLLGYIANSRLFDIGEVSPFDLMPVDVLSESLIDLTCLYDCHSVTEVLHYYNPSIALISPEEVLPKGLGYFVNDGSFMKLSNLANLDDGGTVRAPAVVRALNGFWCEELVHQIRFMFSVSSDFPVKYSRRIPTIDESFMRSFILRVSRQV